MKTLKSLGLTETEAKVYVYLAKKGPLEEKELAITLKFTKKQLSIILEMLLVKGMINVISKSTTEYFAITFEKVLDQSLEKMKKQTRVLHASKEEILSTWRSMVGKHSANS